MSLRRTWPLAALVLAAAVLPAGSASAKPPKAPCSARFSQTLAETPGARLYAVDEDGYEVLGCVKRLGKRFSLFKGDDPAGASCLHTCVRMLKPRLAGAYAAYVRYDDFSYGGGAPEEHSRDVRVFDLRTGRLVRTYPAEPKALLLSAGGTTVALTSATGGGYDLVAHWTFGTDRVLDAGAIDPRSVALDGATVKWAKDGVPAEGSLRP